MHIAADIMALLTMPVAPKKYCFQTNLTGSWRIEDLGCFHVSRDARDLYLIERDFKGVKPEKALVRRVTGIRNPWCAEFAIHVVRMHPVSDVRLDCLLVFKDRSGKLSRVADRIDDAFYLVSPR